jgi:Transcription antiterminator
MEENKQWYVAKVRPHTEKKIKNYLSESGIEHYIPFRTVVVERNGQRKNREKPVISGLIFVYGIRDHLLTLPQDSGFTMAFMRNLETGGFLVVPDKQMKDFMFVLDLSESTVPISNTNLRRGDRVRVIKGELAGIEGELVRIKGHKRVVVRLEGLFSLATTYIPKEHLEKIESI